MSKPVEARLSDYTTDEQAILMGGSYKDVFYPEAKKGIGKKDSRGAIGGSRIAHLALAAPTVLVAQAMLPSSAAAAGCQFVLGFEAIRSQIPDTVGVCTDNESHPYSNGDGIQHTIDKNGRPGLMNWRKADNWTAFTDGYQSWVNGPNGLQNRLNSQRFSWEANPDNLPLVNSSASVTTAEGGSNTASPTESIKNESFPKIIGTSPLIIYNNGQQEGIIDSTDSVNNYAALVNVAKQFSPNETFSIYIFDDSAQIPDASTPQPYRVNFNWGVPNIDGKQLRINKPGSHKLYISIPKNITPTTRDTLNKQIATTVLFFILKPEGSGGQMDPKFNSITAQLVSEPSSNGKDNYPLKLS